jgi:class 3 adenylate cyclase/tetratricopeptide (TPR) repeat protein
MPLCSQCGETNPDRARFCLACGAALPPAAAHEARKTVTVLFCDLVGSTVLGERLDPESVRGVISRYFDAMRVVLERHGGTVEKFIGDAIMAVFGVPAAREDDAMRALRAAVEMRSSLVTLNADFEREWGIRLSVRTGVNTGQVLAGDPSGRESFVSGDTVNVAARLEQTAGPGEILIGEATWSLTRDAVEAEPLEPVALKGKADRLRAWRLAAVAPPDAWSRPLDRSPFVGRVAEVERLRQALEQAISRRACVLATVVGTPGIGKSRLEKEFTISAASGSRVLRGRCLPYGEGITYWPLAEIVRDAGGVDISAVIRRVVKDGADLVGERIASALGTGPAVGSPAEIAWAFRKLIEGLASDQPLVIVIDDVHWAEPTLLDMLEYIRDFVSAAPILLLCLARADIFEVRPSWAIPRDNSVLIPLQPLSEAEVVDLMAGLTGGAVLAEDARTHVMASADGNPLFIEQLLALNTDPDRGGGALVVPATIQALLSARIDRLAPVEREVIECAAVEGRSFHRGALMELVDARHRPAIGASLNALVRKEMTRPDRSLFRGDDAFRFVHILVRDAAYEGIAKRRRADLHQRFAAWLERAATASPADYEEIIAYHLEQAYRCEAELGRAPDASQLAARAGARLAAAGRRAKERGDMPAAISLLNRATAILPPEGPDRSLLLAELATVLTDAGQLAQAAASLAEAEAGIEAGSQPLAFWRATIARLNLGLWTGADSGELAERAAAAAAACSQFGDDVGVARAWCILGRVRTNAGFNGAAQAAFETALDHARRAGAALEASSALQWLLINYWFGPRPASEGIRRCREALQRRPSRTVEACALVELGCFLASQGRFDEGREHLARGLALYEELGERVTVAGVSQEFFDLEMLAGRPAAAEPRLRAACDALEAMGEKGFLPTRLGCLAEALYAQGRFHEAESVSIQAEAAAAIDPTDLDAHYRWRAVRAMALARRDDHGPAETLAREAVAIVSPTDWLNTKADALMALVEVLQLAGRDAEAIEPMREAFELYQRKENLVNAERVRRRLEGISGRPGRGR